MPYPIALFAYNRPRHLKACLEALERAMAFSKREFVVRIFCDAPRRPEHQKNVEETIAVARGWKGAEVVVREYNLGFRNLTEGIGEVCNQFGRAIIIEDDILVAPDFLLFITEALDRYENDPRVWMVSGFMYFDAEPSSPPTFFLAHSFIWGWATWQRAWKEYSWTPVGWEEFVQNKRKRALFNFFGALSFSKMLTKTMKGEWNTWDAQWMYTLFQRGGLALYPHRSLVWNCGVGGGTHGKGERDSDPLLGMREHYLHGNLSLEDFKRPRLDPLLTSGRAFPENVALDLKAMRYLAITFLKERLRKERRRFRLFLKLLLQYLLLPLTPRPK